jgi:hypothetical protein
MNKYTDIEQANKEINRLRDRVTELEEIRVGLRASARVMMRVIARKMVEDTRETGRVLNDLRRSDDTVIEIRR